MGKRILVAVIFVPILFAVMMFLPPVAWALVVAFISAAAAYELLRAVGEGKLTGFMQTLAIVSAAVIPLTTLLGIANISIPTCMFVVAAAAFWCAVRAYGENGAVIGLYQVLLMVFAGGLLPAALASLVSLRCMEQGRYLVLLTVLLAFITDGGAYFAGVFLGKHRGITKVSPNKSVEGYIGGFATGIIFSVLYGLVISLITSMPVNYISLTAIGLLGALVTELGDLAFSFIKRQYGVKDYGNLLPGHGGMLDRFDSMIFCGPVVLFIVTLLPVF